MSCGKSNKTCYAKSCERYYNNNAQAVAAGQTLQLQIAGAKVVDSGIGISAEPQSYTILKRGLYHLSADVVFNATTGGTATFAIYKDGVLLPCTLKTLTLYAGGTAIHTETDLQIDSCCCDVSHNFTFVLTSGTAVGSVVELCTGILKLA